MSLNSLKIATDGYLKKSTKAVLVIAVSGYLNFGGTPPIQQPTGGGHISSRYENVDKDRIQKIIRDDDDIIQVIKIFLQCL